MNLMIIGRRYILCTSIIFLCSGLMFIPTQSYAVNIDAKIIKQYSTFINAIITKDYKTTLSMYYNPWGYGGYDGIISNIKKNNPKFQWDKKIQENNEVLFKRINDSVVPKLFPKSSKWKIIEVEKIRINKVNSIAVYIRINYLDIKESPQKGREEAPAVKSVVVRWPMSVPGKFGSFCEQGNLDLNHLDLNAFPHNDPYTDMDISIVADEITLWPQTEADSDSDLGGNNINEVIKLGITTFNNTMQESGLDGVSSYVDECYQKASSTKGVNSMLICTSVDVAGMIMDISAAKAKKSMGLPETLPNDYFIDTKVMDRAITNWTGIGVNLDKQKFNGLAGTISKEYANSVQ